MGHVEESSSSSSSATSERMILIGDEYRCIDQNGSIVYNSKWFKGMPSMFDIVGQNSSFPPDTPGYNIPLDTTSREWKRLWWSVTDNECDIVPVWAETSLKEFLVWLKRLGFTGECLKISHSHHQRRKKIKSP